ncbi:MAG TPA: hypothetical protein VGQ99_08735 [Tepidisphaeraceae bacterium]|nr:hypothetical protein [Tepidisphaeraceae bacterium]
MIKGFSAAGFGCAMGLALGMMAAAAIAKSPAPDAGEMVTLPMVLPDEQGIRWDIQHDGSIGDGGNDLYDGGGHLYLDGNTQWMSGGTASFSRERNEVVLGPTSYRELNVSRRIAVNSKLGFCRWAEVFENSSGQKTSVRLRVHFDMGGGIQFIQPNIDEKRNKQTIGMAIGDGRHCVGVAGAGRGSRIVPRFEPQQGGDQFNMYYDLEIGPRQTAVIVHAQIYRQQFNAAAAVLGEIKDKEYLAQLPADLQRKVVNFRVGDSAIGDLEILRGEIFDVVELRGGDMLRGEIRQPAYRLETFYGLLNLPVDKVVGLINVGDFRPRQLLVMRDGEVFGGHLAEQEMSVRLSSGQEMRVPLRQIARAGYRRRMGEPEEWNFTKPMVFLRSGDRMEVKLPAAEVAVSTRYGILKLKPQIIGSIAYQSEERSVHEVVLVDGSRFAGLVLMDSYEMELSGQAPGQAVRFSAGTLARIQLNAAVNEPDEATPMMTLANGDALVGTLTGELRLETAFDTIAISSGEVKRLAAMKTSPGDVQILLWDDSLVAGQLREAQLNFLTTSGVAVRVPASLVEGYVQPRPQPSENVIEAIKSLVGRLNADDWKMRDEAQEKLIAMGPVALGTLKQLRVKEGPEAQQRIDLIIPVLEKLGRK